jgi:PAS domain S-box-containing protein
MSADPTDGPTRGEAGGAVLGPEHLASVLSIVAEAVISVDESNTVVFFNRGAERIFGYEASEVMGRPLDPLLPERYRDVHRAHVHAFARSAVTARQMGERLEVRALRKDGQEFPAEASIARTEGPDGAILTVVLRDVSERQRTREELAARERQLAEAQRIAHVGSWQWDVPSNLLHWSDELYRIYGMEPGTPMDFDRFLQQVHPDDADLARDRIQTALESGQSFDFQHRVIRPDGAVRWLHGRGRVELDEQGRPVRMTGTGHDITELRAADARATQLAVEKAAREAAERAERRMAFLAGASAELASSLDHETTLATIARLAVPEIGDWCAVDLLEPDGSIRRLAVAHQDPEKEELVREMSERIPTDPDAPHGVASVIRTGRSELGLDVPDDLLVELAVDQAHLALLRDLGLRSYLVAPLAVRGRVLGAITFVHAESGRRYDEDDRVVAEDLARRAAVSLDNANLVRELAQAVKAKTDFMATVSHELRTPLNAVIGYTELLEEGVPDPIPDGARTYARRIGLSAKHLLQLIDEILTFSRLQADREVVDRHALQIDQLLNEVRVIIGPLAAEAGLDFRVEDQGVPPRVFTDPRKLRQILLNLLGNAIKFTDHGSVELRIRHDQGHLLFDVIDTGPGISPAMRPQLFEPFWQGDQSSTRRIGGAGLGLAISDRFARLLGGEILVHSEPGKGSTFTLRLPLELPPTG